MGCKVESKNGITSITCYRGATKKAKTIVTDKQGNEWFCDCDEYQLSIFPESRPVEVYNSDGSVRKRFMRSFLTLKEKIE